jgi:hypothetical protein
VSLDGEATGARSGFARTPVAASAWIRFIKRSDRNAVDETMAWFAEKGFRLLVVQELTEAQPDYSADVLSGDGERRLQTRYGFGASPAKLHSAREGDL